MDLISLAGIILGGFGFVGLAFATSTAQPTIEGGKFSAIDLEGCQDVGNCFYQNGDNPYSRIVIVDLRTLLLKPDPGLTAFDQYAGAFILNANQALVTFGTAPPSRYWSFLPYLWRTGVRPSAAALIAEQNGSTNLNLTERGALSFSSLTQGVTNFQFPNVAKIAIVTTRNQNVFNREKARLLSIRPDLTVIPLWIPDQAPLDAPLTVICRTTYFLAGTMENFLTNNDFTTYRSTYENIGYAPTRAVTIGMDPNSVPLGILPIVFQKAPLEPSELPLRRQYDRYVQEMLSNFTVVQEINVSPAFVDQYGFLLTDGYQCINAGLPCFGDNPSSTYVSSSSLTTTSGQSLFVVAVSHATTERAFYSNLTIYDDTIKFGVDSEPAPEGRLFYQKLWSYGAGTWRVIERAYVALPLTNVGPDPRTLLLMRVFVVKTPPGTIVENLNAPPPSRDLNFGSTIPLNPNSAGLTDVALTEDRMA